MKEISEWEGIKFWAMPGPALDPLAFVPFPIACFARNRQEAIVTMKICGAEFVNRVLSKEP